MTGGGGDNAFVFFHDAVGGAADIITDFNANDAVYIEGYGSGSAAALQAAAKVTARAWPSH
jgi:Ca2+-binding RTX toxin-like protein